MRKQSLKLAARDISFLQWLRDNGGDCDLPGTTDLGTFYRVVNSGCVEVQSNRYSDALRFTLTVILTTVLGIVGAFLATWIGQAIGWYRPDQGAGFIAAIIGSVLVLFIWNRLVAAHVISDPGAGPRN